MRGTTIKRSKTSFALVLDYGRVAGKRKVKWHSFKPTEPHTSKCTADACSGKCRAQQQAADKLAELKTQLAAGTFVDASKTTLVEYLRDWHKKVVVKLRRPETARVYSSMIEKHVAASPVGGVPLQKVRASDLEEFYASVKLAPASVNVLHAVIHRALKTAVRDRLIIANPAAAVEDRPRVNKDTSAQARLHCWSAEQARSFLTAARDAGTQVDAFFALALDSGARKSELLGLTWPDVDLDSGTVTISRQLDTAGEHPVWGPTKTGRSRTVTLGADTVTRLKQHRRAQATLKMANRLTYADHGLVFACEPGDLTVPTFKLGQPCVGLTTRHYAAVTKAAGLDRLKFHGLRHTAATLLLGAGVPVQVVAQRLGHAQVSMTLEVYAHATPDMQADAAVRLAAVLAVGER
jgi:integrase